MLLYGVFSYCVCFANEMEQSKWMSPKRWSIEASNLKNNNHFFMTVCYHSVCSHVRFTCVFSLMNERSFFGFVVKMQFNSMRLWGGILMYMCVFFSSYKTLPLSAISMFCFDHNLNVIYVTKFRCHAYPFQADFELCNALNDSSMQ